MVFTGLPRHIDYVIAGTPPLGLCPPPPANPPLGKGAGRNVYVFATDYNFNRLEGGTTSSLRLEADKGSLDWTAFSPLTDSYGINLDYRLLDADSGTACATTSHGAGPQSARCVWKTLFYDYEQDTILGSGALRGAGATDTTPCVNGWLQLQVTVRSVTVVDGSPGFGVD